MQKQLKADPPLRETPVRRKAPRKPKDISFSEALHKLKRGFRVKRNKWPDLYLEIRKDDRGDKEIVEKSSRSSQSVRHSFDQTELLANDWMVL